MECNKILELAIKTNDKIKVSPEQLKQLELLVVAYMSAAQLELEDKEISKLVINGLDVKWDSLFDVSE